MDLGGTKTQLQPPRLSLIYTGSRERVGKEPEKTSGLALVKLHACVTNYFEVIFKASVTSKIQKIDCKSAEATITLKAAFGLHQLGNSSSSKKARGCPEVKGKRTKNMRTGRLK